MRRFVLAIAWIWAGANVVGLVVLVILFASEGSFGGLPFGFALLGALYTALGLLMVVRQPGNRVAWVLYLVGTYFVLSGGAEYRIDGPPDPVTALDVFAIVWENTGYFVALLIPLFVLLYIFPTGRFMTRRWSWAGWVGGVIAPIALLAEGFSKEIGLDEEPWTVTNPVGFLESGLDGFNPLVPVFGVGLLALIVGGIPAMVIRYRRSATEVRSQIKWVVYALLLVVIWFISAALYELSGLAGDLLFLFVLAVPAVSITVAITRYRLYEIDRLISRTVSYTLIIGVLSAVFALFTWLPSYIIGGTGNVGEAASAPPLVIAASTLAVAALFNPLRQRVQRGVDRRFNRSRYQAEVISEQFASKLQESLTVEEVGEAWTNTIETALHPESIGIWLSQTSTTPTSAQTHRP